MRKIRYKDLKKEEKTRQPKEKLRNPRKTKDLQGALDLDGVFLSGWPDFTEKFERQRKPYRP